MIVSVIIGGMKKGATIVFTFPLLCILVGCHCQTPALPSAKELNRPFGKHDEASFRSPAKVFHPQTWFHFIGGNVAHAGITADLEAIAGAGISGVQLFHGQFGGPWPGVTPQIVCLSELWEDAVKHTAKESKRLGLRFTMQNCPGWAMSGGPWIEPSNAMRHLVWSRTDIESGTTDITLEKPQPNKEDWRDYRDITVLAFPTPFEDSGMPLKPLSVKSNRPDLPWLDCLAGTLSRSFTLSPVTDGDVYWVEVTFPEVTTIRTVEFSNVEGFNHAWCYEPGVTVAIQAILPDGTLQEALQTAMPQSSWQDDRPLTLACNEIAGVRTYRITILNKQNMALRALRLFSAARKNNWESEAGWTLRSIVRAGENAEQSKASYIDPSQILDIASTMDAQGNLKWQAPNGKWTVLRIGHVNTGMRNSPAPPEGTGWECDKLSEAGPDAHFAGYIGRLSGKDGALANGLLNGMLLDSWECKTQTWTTDMEAEFGRISGYPLRRWLPAVFGYVISDQETTARFLRDWRSVIGDLFANKFYGRMAKLAHDNGLTIAYETAAGDIFPADILEYFKYADVPMCEFWHPFSEGYVGSLNFKPIKPTASAARLYGKPRVAAEAFTSFNLTWDEHWDMLKEVANINCIEGVTHFVFHTYTHNPRTDFLPPGTSFGSRIGTPFLRGQTWWKYMPEFTNYLSRCTYLLERGNPVSDVLWYLGDEINHKPDQEAPFPEGYKYDYCNPDVLLNRLSVRDGMLVTPEGIRYRLLWLPDNKRMLPQTLEKLVALVSEGATIVGNAPYGLATLADADKAQRRFDAAVQNLWGTTASAYIQSDASAQQQSGNSMQQREVKPKREVRKVGAGAVLSGMLLDEALNELNIKPDVTTANMSNNKQDASGEKALWSHRSIDGTDWYYVTSPKGSGFRGTLNFRNKSGKAEIWDPVTGDITPAAAQLEGDRTLVTLDLPQAGSCFVVFREKGGLQQVMKKDERNQTTRALTLQSLWTLSFPEGWGAPTTLKVTTLQAWKDLDISDEGKAFAGSVTYTTTFDVVDFKKGMCYTLDLGRVEMIAAVSLNGKPLRTLWTAPYRVELTDDVRSGTNTLKVEVTGTWFNRLVYDAGLPEENRKTWTINGPSKDEALRESGLLGPVTLTSHRNGISR